MLQDGLEGIMLTGIVLTDPDNDDCTTIVIAIPNLFVHQSIYVMQRFKIIIIIIVYLFTSSDKTIHRDLELLTSTSYTAVDPQGVPAEKPRNLLTLGICLPTHHHRECGFAGTVAAIKNNKLLTPKHRNCNTKSVIQYIR